MSILKIVKSGGPKTIEEVELICRWLGLRNYKVNPDLTVDVDETIYFTFRFYSYPQLPIQFGIIQGDFDCSDNKLTSLKGCPRKVNGDFICVNNSINSLEGGPREVGGDYICESNKVKFTEEDIRKVCNVKGKIKV